MQPSRRHCLYASLALLLCLLAPRTGAETLTAARSPSRATPQSATRSADITNQDVLNMTKAGISARVIVDKISDAPCQFDTSVSALTTLRAAGVDDSVLSAMIHCHASAGPHSQPYVWVGANEERISHGNRATVNARDSADGLNIGTGSPETTAQTHSEYADVTHELSDKCQGIVITRKLSDADYAITVERYHAGHIMSQRNTFSVFRVRDDNLILSDQTTWLKNAAADICEAILRDTTPTKALGGRN
jgi:hypothetical protein